MSSYNSQFGGFVVGSTDTSYAIYNLTVPVPQITLVWPIQYQGSPNTTASIIELTATAGGQSIVMPPATQVSVGQAILLVNKSASNITIFASDAATVLVTLNATSSLYIYLTSKSTVNGTWNIIPFGGGFSAVTSIGINSGTNNIVVTASPANPLTTAGTFTFNVANDLLALSSFVNATGISARTAANTWSLVNLTGTASQITVTNGSGVGGNPTFSLPATITGINNLTVGNVNIVANTISSTNSNGNLNVVPNGTGEFILDSNVQIITGQQLKFWNAGNTNTLSMHAGGLTTNLAWTLPTTQGTIGQVLTDTSGTGVLGWSSVTSFGGPSVTNAIARYSNTTGSLQNSGVLIDNIAGVTGMTSLTVANIGVAEISPNAISTTVGNLILSPNGTSETISSNNVSISNANFLKLYKDVLNTTYTSFNAPSTITVNTAISMPTLAPLVTQELYAQSVALVGGVYNTQFQWKNPTPGENVLINGAFDIWQRNTSFTSATTFYPNNDNIPIADKWKLFSNGNNIVNVSQGGAFNILSGASKYSLQATVQTPNTKFGFGQILESYETYKLLDKQISFSIGLAGTGITTIRAAIISWQGASDIITLPFVTAWNGAGANPSLAANWTYEAVQLFTITNGAQLYTMNNVQISTGGTTNCAVFIWTEDASAIAVGSTLTLAIAKLELGQVNTPFTFRPIEQELSLSKRWFQKDFPHSIALGTPTTAVPSSIVLATTPISVGTYYAEIRYETEMRKTPTIVTYPYTTVTNVNGWSTDGGVDYQLTLGPNSAVPSSDSKSFRVLNSSTGNLTFGQGIVIGHWFADCEF